MTSGSRPEAGEGIKQMSEIIIENDGLTVTIADATLYEVAYSLREAVSDYEIAVDNVQRFAAEALGSVKGKGWLPVTTHYATLAAAHSVLQAAVQVAERVGFSKRDIAEIAAIRSVSLPVAD